MKILWGILLVAPIFSSNLGCVTRMDSHPFHQLLIIDDRDGIDAGILRTIRFISVTIFRLDCDDLHLVLRNITRATKYYYY